MSAYVIDTDTLSLAETNHPLVVPAIRSYRTAGHALGLAIITVEEKSLGLISACRAARGPAAFARASRLYADAVALWGQFSIHPQTVSSLAIYDQLVALRLNVGRNDLRIASVALDLGAIVVTRNRRDFGRVPGLPVGDWSV